MLSFLTDHSLEAEIQSSGKSGDVDDVATPPPVHAIENIAIEPLGRAQLTDLCAEVGPGRAYNLVLWRDQAPTQYLITNKLQ